MVKNTQGGSKHKSQARKLVNAPASSNVRFPQDEGECLAITVKMLGNGMCHVNLIYKDQLYSNVVCHIRGKFRSRNKKNNFVSVGSTLLVGIRDWTSKIDACDLLSVYNDAHIPKLNIPSLLSNSISQQNLYNDDISFEHFDSSPTFDNTSIHNHKDKDNDNDNDNDINFDLI